MGVKASASLHTYAFYTLLAPAAAIEAVIGPLFHKFVSASIDENMRKVEREMKISSPTKGGFHLVRTH